MSVLPSGQQVELRHGVQRAVVVEVGGGLRVYDWGEQSVLDGYAATEMVTAVRGQPLIPWPNRLRGGAYNWRGQDCIVPLDEPERGSASHGLCQWRNWVPTERTESSVTMRLMLYPSPPYPFALELAVQYMLSDNGLVVETSARNVGRTVAPYAGGAHPYVTVGGTVDDALFTLPAGTRLIKDASGIPLTREPVAGTPFDFRSPRALGPLHIDDTFTDLFRGPDGLATTVLTSASGSRTVALWTDQSYPYLQVFTGDTVPELHRRRRGLAIEPMTAPPNALATGEDIVALEPGTQVHQRWGMSMTN